MIDEKTKEQIIYYAKKYNVPTVIIFGSCIEGKENANDIDIGIKGMDPKLFFDFYGELYKNLSKPVDLIDLSDKSLFTELVEKTGIKIYG